MTEQNNRRANGEPIFVLALADFCFRLFQSPTAEPGPIGRMVSKNSALVNFAPESRLPFVQNSSIYQKKEARKWPEISIKDMLGRNGTRISVCKIPSEKIGLPFQMFHSSRKFSCDVFVRELSAPLIVVRQMFRCCCFQTQLKML